MRGKGVNEGGFALTCRVKKSRGGESGKRRGARGAFIPVGQKGGGGGA
jgi:hypothetical protein